MRTRSRRGPDSDLETMKTMKRVRHIFAAGMIAAAALLASCTKGTPIQERTVRLTATLSPNSDSPVTKAITSGKDDDKKEILNVKWVPGEEIAVYYETTGGNHVTSVATVTEVDTQTGAATIEAVMTDPKGGEVSLVYPASLANAEGGIDKIKLTDGQDGLLRTISKSFDAASTDAVIDVKDDVATLRGPVTMVNQVCILKIALNFSSGGNNVSIGGVQGGTELVIGVGDQEVYTIHSPFDEDIVPVGGTSTHRPFRSGDVIYVAMLPADLQSVYFFTDGGNGKMFQKTVGVFSVEAGQFYRNVDVSMSSTDARPSFGTFVFSDHDPTLTLDGDYIGCRFLFPYDANVTLMGNGTALYTCRYPFLDAVNALNIWLGSDYTIFSPHAPHVISGNVRLGCINTHSSLIITCPGSDKKGINTSSYSLSAGGCSAVLSSEMDNGDGTWTYVYTVTKN